MIEHNSKLLGLVKQPASQDQPKMGELQRLKGLNVANHLEKRSLLIAINSIAALSIFFFGYDQGMMGGVNVSLTTYQSFLNFQVQDRKYS